ncbi:MAG: PadR family transcriptional regulator [Planctomycetota bacterium]
MVLLALVQLDEDCHGIRVRRVIEHCTGRRISTNAVYTTLHRLEERGYLRSWKRPAVQRTAWRIACLYMAMPWSNNASRFFALTDEGRDALREALLACDRLRAEAGAFSGAALATNQPPVTARLRRPAERPASRQQAEVLAGLRIGGIRRRELAWREKFRKDFAASYAPRLAARRAAAAPVKADRRMTAD